MIAKGYRRPGRALGKGYEDGKQKQSHEGGCEKMNSRVWVFWDSDSYHNSSCTLPFLFYPLHLSLIHRLVLSHTTYLTLSMPPVPSLHSHPTTRPLSPLSRARAVSFFHSHYLRSHQDCVSVLICNWVMLICNWVMSLVGGFSRV